MYMDILVIGDINHPRATCVHWLDSFPNIEEFDLVIVAQNTLSQEMFDQIADRLKGIQSQILTVFKTGRPIWCIIERLMFPSPPKSSFKGIAPNAPTNYDWLFVHPIINEVNEGRSVTIVDRRFESFIEKVQKWKLEIDNIYGLEAQYGMLRPVIAEGLVLEPIALNKSGKMLGARMIGVDPDLYEGSGEVCLLPKPSEGDTHEAIETLINIAIETGSGKLLVPDYSLSAPVVKRVHSTKEMESKEYDAFICHASEDKKEVAEPLAKMLIAKDLKVWYDRFTLTVGDSLRQKIDDGLARSRYGVVILSPSFFKKDWPKRELDGLAAIENSEGRKVILPVWHDIDRDQVVKYSPTLAGRLASKTKEGLEVVLNDLLKVILEPRGNQPTRAVPRYEQRGSRSETVPASRMVPVSPFRLSTDLEKKLKVARGYTAAFAIHWEKDNPWIVMWYDPMMPGGLGAGTDLGGGQLDPADFLDIVELNPALRNYEFGLTGKPKSALIVIIEGTNTEAWVAPLKFVDSLMGIQESERIRKAIRALV